jgi:uncharacterized XkdX family phage protein
MTFEIIKQNYEHKLWNETQVRIAVKKGVITPTQFKEITGKNY